MTFNPITSVIDITPVQAARDLVTRRQEIYNKTRSHRDLEKLRYAKHALLAVELDR